MTKNTLLILQLYFTAFTAVLYDMLLLMIFKGRKKTFKSPFFTLFTSAGIADMLYLWNRILATHLPVLFFADQWIAWNSTLVSRRIHLYNENSDNIRLKSNEKSVGEIMEYVTSKSSP